MLANTIIIPIMYRMTPIVMTITLIAIKPNAGAIARATPIAANNHPTRKLLIFTISPP